MATRNSLLSVLVSLVGDAKKRSKAKRRNQLRRLMFEPMEERRLLATIDLATLGSSGTTIFGADASDQSGYSVSDAGDVNGDGFDDFVIGARFATSGLTKTYSGETYLIFGSASPPATIDLANLGALGPTVGITISGANANDYSGISVSSAGDVNGDGFDDLIIGANYADRANFPANSPSSNNNAGKSYVIFGKSNWTATPTITLSDVLNTPGFTILGEAAAFYSGNSVSGAGDVNGDGFDDLIVGASFADPSGISVGNNNAGKSYVIFGKSNWSTTPTITLSDNLGATNPGVGGFTILGQAAYDLSGGSVSSAGDVNGDGFDDLIIGAPSLYTGSGTNAGKSYVIFGAASHPSTINLANLGLLGPTVGITILGADSVDGSGISVSSGGDVNGDGFDDLIIGAVGAAASGNAKPLAGESYLIFGAASLPGTINLANLSNLGPTVGVTIFGAAAQDQSGFSVSSAGDVNGDGFDDLLIGTRFAGGGYVVFGAASFLATIDLATLGSAGISILGQPNYGIGRSVSSAGDVNGDGFHDLIIGAPLSDGIGNLEADAGESYLLYGGNGFTNSILPANLGTSTANTINGTSAANILNGANGDDILVGLGGADILLGGRGNDTLAISDLNFRRIVGGNGNDTLRLDGAGLSLNLTMIRDNRIVDIEEINITGSGNNTLTLTAREVLNLSSHSNTLLVRRNSGDIVDRGSGWTQIANETIGGLPFEVFTQGAATLMVQLTGLSPVVGFSSTPVTYIENAAPLAIFSGVTITDADTPTLTNGVLTITNTNGESTDRLSIASSNFVTILNNTILVGIQVIGTFTGGAGTTPLVVTFTNQASLNRVVAVLSLIRFSSVSESPSGVSRIISVRLTDGSGGTSAIVNRTVGVTPVADAPIVTLPTTPVTYVENAAPLAVFTGATITDADTPVLSGGVLTITNTNGEATDRLSIVSSSFVIVSGNSISVSSQVIGTFTGGTGITPLVVTFTNQASLNRIVAVLSLVRFSSVSESPSGVSRVVSVRLTDGSGGTSAIVNRTVGVTPVIDAPIVTLPTTPVTYVENAAPLAIFTGATIADADTPVLSGGVLTITNTNGEATDRLSIVSSSFVTVSSSSISVSGQAIATFTGGTGTTPLIVTFNSQGALNRVVAVLSLVRFSNVSDSPSGISRIVSVRLTDGSGGTSAVVNRTIGVTPVNDAPVIGSIGPAVTFTRSGPRVLVFSSTSTITDLDNTVFTGGTLTIANTNGQATDSLAIVPNASITVSGASVSFNGTAIGTFTGGAGTTPLVFTFNSQATPARIRLMLLAVGFANSSSTPSTTPRTISVQITDGVGGTSALQSKLVNVI